MSALTDRMNGIIGFVPRKKKRVEQKLQAVGRNIGKNLEQGQKDLKDKKIGHYDSIDPFKGTVDAWKNG